MCLNGSKLNTYKKKEREKRVKRETRRRGVRRRKEWKASNDEFINVFLIHKIETNIVPLY